MKLKSDGFLFFLLILGISIVFSGCGGSPQPTINCSVADLSSTIAHANANPDHDHIILPEDCDFELGEVKYEIPDEGYDYDLEFAGLPSITSPITITGNNSRIFRSTMPGTADFRIFHIGPGGSLTLHELTLENGSVIYYGGAILMTGGTLSINQADFYNNHAIDYGGAIATYDWFPEVGEASEIYIINSIFRNNSASEGGAVYIGTECCTRSYLVVCFKFCGHRSWLCIHLVACWDARIERNLPIYGVGPALDGRIIRGRRLSGGLLYIETDAVRGQRGIYRC